MIVPPLLAQGFKKAAACARSLVVDAVAVWHSNSPSGVAALPLSARDASADVPRWPRSCRSGSARNARAAARAALDQAHAWLSLRPSARSAPTEIRCASRAACATGWNQCSNMRRGPASAPTRLMITISPPGLSTRANSSSAGSGIGHRIDDILRDHHVEGRVGKCQILGVHHREALDVAAAPAR